MVNDDLVKQVASDLCQRLLGKATPAVANTAPIAAEPRVIEKAPPAPAAAQPIPLPLYYPSQSVPTSLHPSQQRVNVQDALNEFVEFLQTKQCIMEKGKPCDRCDICNTLGF